MTGPSILFQGCCPHRESESILFNPGPRFRAGMILVRNGLVVESADNRAFENELDGNPFGWCAAGTPCADGDLWEKTPDGSCPSFYSDTTVGWTYQEMGTDPGWEVREISGGNGVPLEYEYVNLSLDIADPCTLREIGLIWHKWNIDDNYHCFKVNDDNTPIRLGDFSEVYARVKCKLGVTEGPIACLVYPTAMVTGDFRVIYVDEDDVTVRTDLLGIHMWEMAGSIHGTPVMWEDGGQNQSTWRKQLSGDYIGIPQLTTNKFTSYNWEMKQYLQTYLPPPDGYTIDDAVVVGWDVYCSARGANITFRLKESDIVGVTIT